MPFKMQEHSAFSLDSKQKGKKQFESPLKSKEFSKF